MAIIAYPLNNIDYDAEDAQSYFAPRTAGIFSLGKDYVVSSAGGMEMTVSTGRGWMKPSEFTGFSVVSTEPTTLTVAESHPTMDRYDRVVLRYDKGANTVEILIVQGTPATDAKAPDIQRTDSIYELGLAVVHVPAGALELTADNIEDTRKYTDVCGIASNDWTGGQSIITATFDDALAGKVYTVLGPEEETIVREVPDGLVDSFSVAHQNASYEISIDNIDPVTVVIGPYYGEYTADVFYESPDYYDSLNSASWATISKHSKDGTAPSIYAVGDYKEIELSGKIINLGVQGMKIVTFILGFNHNSSIEGENLIHFGSCKLGDQLGAILDNEYGTFVTDKPGFRMNITKASEGGWADCWAFENLCGNGSDPASPKENTILASLPENLRAVLREMNKPYQYVRYINGTRVYIYIVSCYISFLCKYEMTGGYVYPEESGKFQEYDYFKSGNYTGVKPVNIPLENFRVWLRDGIYGSYGTPGFYFSTFQNLPGKFDSAVGGSILETMSAGIFFIFAV